MNSVSKSHMALLGFNNFLHASPPSAAYMRQWMRQALETNLSKILIKIQNFSFTKMHLQISSAKRGPFCQRGDELTAWLNTWIQFVWCLFNCQTGCPHSWPNIIPWLFPVHKIPGVWCKCRVKRYRLFHLAASYQHSQMSILHLFIVYMKYMMNKKYWTFLYVKDFCLA